MHKNTSDKSAALPTLSIQEKLTGMCINQEIITRCSSVDIFHIIAGIQVLFYYVQ